MRNIIFGVFALITGVILGAIGFGPLTAQFWVVLMGLVFINSIFYTEKADVH